MDLLVFAFLMLIIAIIIWVDYITDKQKDFTKVLFIWFPSSLAFVCYYITMTARPGTIGYLAVYGVLGK